MYIYGYDYYHGWLVGIREPSGCIDVCKSTTELAFDSEQARQRADELNEVYNANHIEDS